MDWSKHYPKQCSANPVRFADVGCGYGGLLVALGPLFPDTLMLGMEIRVKVAEFVSQRIRALRAQHETSALYQNISVLRANAMKFLPNFFEKAQVFLDWHVASKVVDKNVFSLSRPAL